MSFPLCAAGAGNGTGLRTQRAAAAVALGSFGAAAWAAAGGQRFGKFAEFGGCVVHLGQFSSDRFNFGRHFAQKVKEQRATVEQMLDVEQRGGDAVLSQTSRTRVEGLLPIFFEPRFQ